MKELSLHLLDIAENSINACANHITIDISDYIALDRLQLSVKDNGKGMTAEMASQITDPFVTSRTTRKVGLGIPLLKAAAELCNGSLTIESTTGKGTGVFVDFQRSHIDRMPIGDLVGTLLQLVIGSPQIHWTFIYRTDNGIYEFDDEEIKQELDGIPLSEPAVVSFLRNEISTGINNINFIKDIN